MPLRKLEAEALIWLYPKQARRCDALDYLGRASLYKRYSELEVKERYQARYGLAYSVTLQDIEKHAALEQELTSKLLEANPEDHTWVFQEAYTTLYEELPWLAGTGCSSGAAQWETILQPRSRIIEIGSGAGYLINHLAAAGHDCTATDLSATREEEASRGGAGIVWRRTDGVNLSRREAAGTFDYVLSDQVVEHLHPEDVGKHFREAWTILKPGGAYIVRTPYRFVGPHDLSWVFGDETARFMHLHEFTYADMRGVAATAGFLAPEAVFILRKARGEGAAPIVSGAYFNHLLRFERLILRHLPYRIRSRFLRQLARYARVPSNVWVKLTKPG